MSENELKAELVARFPEYERAFKEFIQETYEKLFKASDPILNMIESRKVETCGSVVSLTNDGPYESNPVPLKVSIQVMEEDVLNANFNPLIAGLYRDVMNNLDVFMPRVAEMVSKTAVVGGEIYMENFSWDEFLDDFENSTWNLNPDSDSKNLCFVVSPEVNGFLAQHPPTADQVARREAIIKRKMEESRANKRHRRLS